MMGDEFKIIRETYLLPTLAKQTVKLKRNGSAWMGLCPFHDDKNPSLAVYDHHFICFACGAKGSALDWVMRTRNVDLIEALHILQDKHTLPPTATNEIIETKQPLPEIEEDWIVGHPRAYAYFRSRGLEDTTIAKFRLGYKPYWRFVIPTYDLSGRLVHATYRKDPKGEGDRVAAKYIAKRGSKAALFNIQCLEGADRVYIAEGQIDAMVLSQLGYSAVSSTVGAKGWLPEWCPLFNDKEVVLCLDNDETGVAARSIIQDRILAHGRPKKIFYSAFNLRKDAKDVGEHYVNLRREYARKTSG
jgi:DNA primase